MDEADQRRFADFTLLGLGRLKFGDLADWQLHQFVLSLQPIVDLMSGLAAPLEKNLMGSLADLSFGWANEIHTDIPPVSGSLGANILHVENDAELHSNPRDVGKFAQGI